MNVHHNGSMGFLRLTTLCARGNELFLLACTHILEAEVGYVSVVFNGFQRSHGPTWDINPTATGDPSMEVINRSNAILEN